MILLDVTLEAHDNAHAGLLALSRQTEAGSRVEQGCLLYRVTSALDAPNRLHIVELWETEADLLAHAKGAVFRHFITELPNVGKLVSSVARQGELTPYTIAHRK